MAGGAHSHFPADLGSSFGSHGLSEGKQRPQLPGSLGVCCLAASLVRKRTVFLMHCDTQVCLISCHYKTFSSCSQPLFPLPLQCEFH